MDGWLGGREQRYLQWATTSNQIPIHHRQMIALIEMPHTVSGKSSRQSRRTLGQDLAHAKNIGKCQKVTRPRWATVLATSPLCTLPSLPSRWLDGDPSCPCATFHLSALLHLCNSFIDSFLRAHEMLLMCHWRLLVCLLYIFLCAWADMSIKVCMCVCVSVYILAAAQIQWSALSFSADRTEILMRSKWDTLAETLTNLCLQPRSVSQLQQKLMDVLMPRYYCSHKNLQNHFSPPGCSLTSYSTLSVLTILHLPATQLTLFTHFPYSPHRYNKSPRDLPDGLLQKSMAILEHHLLGKRLCISGNCTNSVLTLAYWKLLKKLG